jgi:O-6-methylguanine DNA methyltransferase
MKCKEVQTYLDAYRTKELTEQTQVVIENHISTCSTCSKELSFAQSVAVDATQLRINVPAEMDMDVIFRQRDQYGTTDTDLGRAWIGYTPKGLSVIKMGMESDESFEQYYTKRIGRQPVRSHVPEKYKRAIQKVLRGEKPPKVPLALEELPEFERTVLHHLSKIPFGEVRPYAWLAKEAGNPGAVRAVGTIMARNPIPFILPCHRIIPSDGGVGNYGYGTEMKRVLLEREGVSPNDLEGWKRQRIRYIGSRTTGIYCYPTCRDARRISWENQISFSSESDASANGYRPCKHCRPLH